MKKAGAITLLMNIQNEYKTETEVIFSFLKNTFLSIINQNLWKYIMIPIFIIRRKNLEEYFPEFIMIFLELN